MLKIKDVSVEYPVYERPSTSIRRDIIRVATGGKLFSDIHNVAWVRALDEVDFTLKAGDRLGLIGTNGAGKSTLLKVIAGVLNPSRGSRLVEGRMSSILTVGGGIDPERSGRANATFMGKMMGVSNAEMKDFIQEIEDFAELGNFFDFPVRTYSAGMILRLAYGVSTSINPEILVLDEGIMAGDEHFAAKAAARVNKIYDGVKILTIASHSKEFLRQRCNKGLVLHQGKTMFYGAIDDALNFYAEGAYLA